MGIEQHYSLASTILREIRTGAIRVRYPGGTIGSWELAYDFGCSSTTAQWALRLLAKSGLIHKIGETSYGSEIYRLFEAATIVKIPAVELHRTLLN